MCAAAVQSEDQGKALCDMKKPRTAGWVKTLPSVGSAHLTQLEILYKHKFAGAPTIYTTSQVACTLAYTLFFGRSVGALTAGRLPKRERSTRQ